MIISGLLAIAFFTLLCLSFTAGPVLLILLLIRLDERRHRRATVAGFDAMCDAYERAFERREARRAAYRHTRQVVRAAVTPGRRSRPSGLAERLS
jgi:hypothetical protein